jgi:HSF-type DNA-binding
MCRNPMAAPHTAQPRPVVTPPSTTGVVALSQHNNTLLFPWKLHEMLVATERAGQDSIVSWVPDGKAFKVHNSAEFVKTVMPCHFKQTKYKSFQRQLNLWGFKRITRSGDASKGAYSHPFFLKGQKSLCKQLCRQSNAAAGSSNSTSASSSKAKEAIRNAPVSSFEIPSSIPSHDEEPGILTFMDFEAPSPQLSHENFDMAAVTVSFDNDQAQAPSRCLLEDHVSTETSPVQELAATRSPEMQNMALFEGCQFFLLDDIKLTPVPEQSISMAPPALEEPEVASMPSFLPSMFDVVESQVVTPPSSPRYEEVDDLVTNNGYDMDPLMFMPGQEYAV